MNKNKKKKAFTLVELLAVIVILAVILIIAVPQIMEAIKETKLKTMEDSAKLIATNAEKDYLAQQALNSSYNATSIPCSDVAKLNDDYSTCTITYDSNGIATVKLKGATGGKFNKLECIGTKDNMQCSKAQTAAEILFMKIGMGGLIIDDHNDLRYQGMTVDNYVTFNNETAGWRIIGVFDERIKLVRNDYLGVYSYDTLSDQSSYTNSGYGVNEWSKSKLMKELNEDYLDTTLTSNTNWYNGINNKKTAVFVHTKKLSSEAQKLIGDAIWYLGGSTNGVNLATQYENERGTNVVVPGTTCSGIYCDDKIVRTTRWVGKVGLIYASDIGYSSANVNCKNNLTSNCNSWLKTGSFYWTISPATDAAPRLLTSDAGGNVGSSFASNAIGVRPAVYLIPDVQISGSGTESDPYVFIEG